MPPPPIAGIQEGVGIVGAGAYFQAWKLRKAGNPASLSPEKSWIACVNTRTGVTAGKLSLPLKKQSDPLFRAVTVPRGVIFYCACGRKHARAWWYTPSTGAISRRFLRSVPKGGGLVYASRYGLVAWDRHGGFKRLAQANMATARKRVFAGPPGIANAHVVYVGGRPLLACVAFLGGTGNPAPRPAQTVLYMYDLSAHKVLWSKTFRGTFGSLAKSFAASPGGNLFTFINWRRQTIQFYNHRNGQLTEVRLPSEYQASSLRYDRVISVR